ncbi:YdcF family protein [Gemella haemolysans]|uniref:YdcF family protein n=1 Tax=Gemella haemolysans TaxID=1379 RepID=UPI00232B4EAC|nr:YdcF family protein [Gemella haemolysans]MDB6213974.1 YdcF family protein [Gemella haemolysans]
MFLYNSFMLIRREGLRVGNLLSLAVFFFLVGYFTYWPRVATYTRDNILLNTLYVYISLVVLYFLCIAMSYLVSSVLNFINILPRKIDYVVVLGAGLIGERVTPLLASRIRKGIKVYKDNPGSKLIMSGGQGPDEVVSEAFAMKNYALEQGINENDIILEDKSTSTEENIIFSKKFIPADKSFAVVTNYYHVYRALVQARTLGFRCIGYGAPTKFYFSLNAFIREFIGYLYFKRRIHAIVLGVLTSLFIAAVLVEIYFWANNS